MLETGFTVLADFYYHVFTSRVENIVDPDQLASQKPTDLNLQFSKKTYPGSTCYGQG